MLWYTGARENRHRRSDCSIGNTRARLTCVDWHGHGHRLLGDVVLLLVDHGDGQWQWQWNGHHHLLAPVEQRQQRESEQLLARLARLGGCWARDEHQRHQQTAAEEEKR